MKRAKLDKFANCVPGDPNCQFCHGGGCLACKGKPKKKAKEPGAGGYMLATRDGSMHCSCQRCGRACRVAGPFKEKAEMFRRSRSPQGLCSDCVMTEFLYNTYPINMQIDEAGPELLLKPGVGEAFMQSMILERGDLTIEEISWERIVANWELPVKVSKDSRNPYRMGDERKRRESLRKYRLDQWVAMGGKPEDLPKHEDEDRPWARHFQTNPEDKPQLPPGCLMRDGSILVDASGFRAGGGSDGSDFGEAVENFLRHVPISGRPS